jgi:tRNA pseudouridine(38-40) synthase
MIRRYLMKIEYFGPRFNGWQVQRDDSFKYAQQRDPSVVSNIRTVSGEIERALINSQAGTLHGHLVGAGRTDAGVHALGQAGRENMFFFRLGTCVTFVST